MAEITFTEDTLRFVALFETTTGVAVVDCIDTEEQIIFVVKHGEFGRAIGKGGANIQRLRRSYRKDLHVIEHSPNPAEFVANVFKNYGVQKVDIEPKGSGLHATVKVEATQKARAIGRGGKNLKLARNLISRHTPVTSVLVA